VGGGFGFGFEHVSGLKCVGFEKVENGDRVCGKKPIWL